MHISFFIEDIYIILNIHLTFYAYQTTYKIIHFLFMFLFSFLSFPFTFLN